MESQALLRVQEANAMKHKLLTTVCRLQISMATNKMWDALFTTSHLTSWVATIRFSTRRIPIMPWTVKILKTAICLLDTALLQLEIKLTVLPLELEVDTKTISLPRLVLVEVLLLLLTKLLILVEMHIQTTRAIINKNQIMCRQAPLRVRTFLIAVPRLPVLELMQVTDRQVEIHRLFRLVSWILIHRMVALLLMFIVTKQGTDRVFSGNRV